MCYNAGMSESCKLCPVECGADRAARAGACGCDARVRVAKYGLHPFEEPCISCKNGSGTVFFSGCALRCVFCQNFEISRAQTGKIYTPRELSELFRALEEAGAENINLVTAAHYAPQVAEALSLRRPNIPVVYNTHAYEKADALRLLDRYIDVWLPDLKYFSPAVSARYTGRSDYFEVASEAVRFMSGRAPVFSGDKMLEGCIVRHLILPLCANDSVQIVRWFAELGSQAYFSLMAQYVPCGEADKFPELRRRITPREYRKVRDELLATGCERVFLQELGAADEKFIPDFGEGTALF